MMRSLSSGVAGLRSHQTKMDVIGNNISNVNTYGFKASRTTFADVYYQNVSGASSGATGVQGGRNPTQIGYGASVATVDIAQTVAGAASTDFALDLYISGDGFLVSRDPSGKTMYTRLGKLDFDSAGNLVDGSGNLIQGFPMKQDGTPDIGADGTITGSELSTIYCDPEVLQKLKGITISPTGMITGIMAGDKIVKSATKPPNFINGSTMSVDPESDLSGEIKLAIGALPDKDNLASSLGITIEDLDFGNTGLAPADGTSINYTFAFDGQSTFKLTVHDATNTKNDGKEYTGVVQPDGTVTLKAKGSSATAFTMKVDPASLVNGPVTIDTDPAGANPNANFAADMNALKYQITTKDDGQNVRRLPETGPVALGPNPTGINVAGISIEFTANPAYPYVGSVGSITPDENILYPIGNLVLAKFPNPSGMLEAGSSYFEQTSNSGEPALVRPGLDGTGGLKSGYLEMSNVDVSKEFTDMITTQRGFQANSRIISVSDTMLEELVNLKR